MNGLRLAVAWLTVLPIRGPREVDRAGATRAIALTPLVGATLGAIAALLMWVLSGSQLPSALAGLVVVTVLALATRGMHLDGLADTFDGLGCYGPPERAREVMKAGGLGAFGAAALIICVLAQAFSLATLAQQRSWLAVALVVAVGRIAVVLACRSGIAAAPGAGFGALVAGTQRVVVALAWSAAAVVASGWALARWWQGPVVVLVTLLSTVGFVRHCVRRFGGLNGDVLGAVIETSFAVAAVGLCL